jgi:hypothetical protein
MVNWHLARAAMLRDDPGWIRGSWTVDLRREGHIVPRRECYHLEYSTKHIIPLDMACMISVYLVDSSCAGKSRR